MSKRQEKDNSVPDPTVGFGSEYDGSDETPARMRDCVKENYWEIAEGDLFTGAGRLANDMRRRGYSKGESIESIFRQIKKSLKRNLNTEENKIVRGAIDFMYRKGTRSLSCSQTGKLVIEGLCFRNIRKCEYWDEEQRIRTYKRTKLTEPLSLEWMSFLDAHIRQGGLYSRWVYTEFIRLEHERNLIPGDENTPILFGFRKLAVRVTEHTRNNHFNKDNACAAVNFLIELGLVKKTIQGKSGKIDKKANGYIRTIPLPPVPGTVKNERES